MAPPHSTALDRPCSFAATRVPTYEHHSDQVSKLIQVIARNVLMEAAAVTDRGGALLHARHEEASLCRLAVTDLLVRLQPFTLRHWRPRTRPKKSYLDLDVNDQQQRSGFSGPRSGPPI